MPLLRHRPSMICVSKLTASKKSSNSIIASPTQSCGTGVPSLNWSGTVTSYRRHLVISCPTYHREGEILHRQRLERSLRHDYLAGAQGSPRKTPGEEAKRSFHQVAVRKLDGHHGCVAPFQSGSRTVDVESYLDVSIRQNAACFRGQAKPTIHAFQEQPAEDVNAKPLAQGTPKFQVIGQPSEKLRDHSLHIPFSGLL